MVRIKNIAIIFSSLLIAFSVFYYLVIFIPRRESIRLEQSQREAQAREDENQREVATQEEEKLQRRKDLENCLEEAYQHGINSMNIYDQLDCSKYSGDIEVKCEEDKKASFDEILATRKEEEALCYERFN